MSRADLLAEFDGSVCPACHHRAHDPGSCSDCPRCELHTDEALAFVLRVEPSLVVDVERLGFASLLAIARALLTHYPPDTIVCSHSVKADIGARTVAAISDLVASCAALFPADDEEMGEHFAAHRLAQASDSPEKP